MALLGHQASGTCLAQLGMADIAFGVCGSAPRIMYFALHRFSAHLWSYFSPDAKLADQAEGDGLKDQISDHHVTTRIPLLCSALCRCLAAFLVGLHKRALDTCADTTYRETLSSSGRVPNLTWAALLMPHRGEVHVLFRRPFTAHLSGSPMENATRGPDGNYALAWTLTTPYGLDTTMNNPV